MPQGLHVRFADGFDMWGLPGCPFVDVGGYGYCFVVSWGGAGIEGTADRFEVGRVGGGGEVGEIDVGLVDAGLDLEEFCGWVFGEDEVDRETDVVEEGWGVGVWASVQGW